MWDETDSFCVWEAQGTMSKWSHCHKETQTADTWLWIQLKDSFMYLLCSLICPLGLQIIPRKKTALLKVKKKKFQEFHVFQEFCVKIPGKNIFVFDVAQAPTDFFSYTVHANYVFNFGRRRCILMILQVTCISYIWASCILN